MSMTTASILNWNIKIKPSDELIKVLLDIDEDVEILPQNISTLLRHYKDIKNTKEVFKKKLNGVTFTPNELKILEELQHNDFNFAENDCEIFNLKGSSVECVNSIVDSNCKENNTSEIPLNSQNKKEDCCLEINDIKWLNNFLYEKRSSGLTTQFLHEILVGCAIILPENEVLERNPVLEARCQKLKAEQENRDYKNMTKNVDAVRRTMPEDTISYHVKSINKQLIAVLQFVFSVAAGFAFGFVGVELIFGNLDFGFRLLLGIICALTIALAELYFLAKKLNEIDEGEGPSETYGAEKKNL